MSTAPDVSLVLIHCPAKEDWLSTLASARRQAGAGEIVVVHPPGAELHPSMKDIRAVEAARPGASGLYAAALGAASLPYVILVHPFARLSDGALSRFRTALADPRVGLALSSYTEPGNTSPMRIYADDSDLSECDLGFVKAFRSEALADAGHPNPDLAHAYEYDLRLRLLERYGSVTIDEPLYALTRRRAETFDGEGGPLGSLVPAESPYGGYTYLFYPPDKEAELAGSFKASLARRRALCREASPIVCPHRSAGPRVSVIIRTKNRRELLVRAIESVSRGSFDDFEILVVDTGSNDGTREAISRLRSDRLRLIAADGANLAQAFNIGFRAARGTYVSELDSDDEYTVSTLEKQVAHLDANPDCALAISYYRLVDIHGAPIERFGIIRHAEFDRDNILRTSGAGAVRTWHRCVLERLGGQNEIDFPDYAEDYDLILRAAEQFRIDRVHEVLYLHRRHTGNSERMLTLDQTYARKTLARRLALERRAEAR